MKINKLKMILSFIVLIIVFGGCSNLLQLQTQQAKYEEKQKIIDRVNKNFNNKIEKLGNKLVNKTDIVYDNSSNLTWQDNKENNTIKRDWKNAKKYCENLTYKNYSDWYLPSITDLKTIVDKNQYNYHKKEFNHTIDSRYWSSSSYPSDINYAWYIYFRYGISNDFRKSDKGYVRCVKRGQITTLTFDNSKNHKLYKTIDGKERIENNFLYSKSPVKEIMSLVQAAINLYFAPREISKDILNKISKPNLPILLKFTKGEYETKANFQIRANSEIKKREEQIKQLQNEYRIDVENRNKIITKLSKEIEAEQKYKNSVLSQKIAEFQKGAFQTVMGGFKFEKRSYDVETSNMYVTMKANRADYSKKISLKVSPEYAKSFSDNIANVNANPTFNFTNNKITLKSINANYSENTYLAVLNNKDFVPENIEVSIKEIKVEFDSAKQMRLSLQNPNLKDTYQVEALAYKDGKEIKGQNFDDDIPTLLSKIKSTKIDNTKWLFTIGIENYAETDNITYAKRSAELFKKVAKKTLGIKERNSYTLINSKATGTAIKNKLRLLLSEVKKGDTIYFYYNGHGIPDPSKQGEPYMLPSDGIPDFIVSEKEFSLKNIYKKLSDSQASKVVAFVDSCFSGATDGVSIIKGVAGSRLASKKVKFDKSKMVVITAGQKKQYSNMYQEKGHRMFSYFVMKSLLNGKKDINMLFKEVSYKVSETSNELGALKKQEPTLDGNIKIKL